MKKLLSGLLTVVMFFAILLAIVLFGVRSALGTNSVSQMLDVMIDDYDIAESLFNGDEDIEEILEDKKAKKLMSKVVSGYVKYTMGITDNAPDVEALLEYVAEETDADIDEDEIDEIVDEFEDEMEQEREAAENDDELAIFKTLFSSGLLIGTVAVIAACAFGIYYLSKDAEKAVKRIGIVAIINGVIVLGLGTAMMSIIEQEAGASDEAMMAIVEVMLNNFKTTGIVGIILGIVLIVVAIKALKKNSSIAKSNQAIQELDNSVIK